MRGKELEGCGWELQCLCGVLHGLRGDLLRPASSSKRYLSSLSSHIKLFSLSLPTNVDRTINGAARRRRGQFVLQDGPFGSTGPTKIQRKVKHVTLAGGSSWPRDWPSG